jgi:hypothetical protein
VTQNEDLQRWASFSRCRRFRTALGRTWNEDGPIIGFVGLNPSTADHRTDDPTLRRCMGFARRLGGGSLVLVNLFAFRATRPADLWAADAPVGATTDSVLRRVLRDCPRVVACWGAIPTSAVPRARRVLAMVDRLGPVVCHLGQTKAGHPRHPLYLRAAAEVEVWRAGERGPPYDGPLPPP